MHEYAGNGVYKNTCEVARLSIHTSVRDDAGVIGICSPLEWPAQQSSKVLSLSTEPEVPCCTALRGMVAKRVHDVYCIRRDAAKCSWLVSMYLRKYTCERTWESNQESRRHS
jgi:hypothetical protein